MHVVLQLAMGKMMDQGPVLIITFQAQLVMVIRNSKGEVVEGDPVRHTHTHTELLIMKYYRALAGWLWDLLNWSLSEYNETVESYSAVWTRPLFILYGLWISPRGQLGDACGWKRGQSIRSVPCSWQRPSAQDTRLLPKDKWWMSCSSAVYKLSIKWHTRPFMAPGLSVSVSMHYIFQTF